MLETGSVFGRYTILGHLGAGGMGSVYVATDQALGRRVALKLLLSEAAAANPTIRARFLREARAAASIHHPNAVTMFDVGEVEGVPYLAMELVEGESLRAHLDRRDLPLAQRLAVLRQVAEALGAAHAKGVVHRDVKPENIVIAQSGEAKVLDFGVAKQDKPVDPSGATEMVLPALTSDGAVVGTPAYMSPEQLNGGVVDARADQFAWGLVAYELLSDVHPWADAANAYSLAAAIITRPAQPLHARRADLPGNVVVVVERALSKKAEDRFPSMMELLAAWNEQVAQSMRPTATVDDTSRASLLRSPAAAPARSKRWVVAGGVALAGVVAFAAAAGRREVATPSAAPGLPASVFVAAAPASATAPVPVSALPDPPSTSPEAIGAYREGLTELRNANSANAEARFSRALIVDPDLVAAAAQLVALSRSYHDHSPEFYRDLHRRANAGRSRLSPRDAALLDALEPGVIREPPDRVEAGRRLTAVSERFPLDAQLAMLAASGPEQDPATRLRRLDKALALDPASLETMRARARALTWLGRPADAIAQLEACVALHPESDCAEDDIIAVAGSGDCAGAEAKARAFVTQTSGSEASFRWLFATLAANGAPDEEVSAALHKLVGKLPAEARDEQEARLHAAVSVLEGKLNAADRRARDLTVVVAGRTDALSHESATALAAEITIERGGLQDVARRADAFFAQQSTWTRGSAIDDATPVLLDALQATGTLSHEEARRRMLAWKSRERQSTSPQANEPIDLEASILVQSRAEAETTLREAPTTPPRLLGKLQVRWVARLGRLELLAEKPAAAASLELVTKSCLRVFDPFAWVQAHLWLGQAKEANKDHDGACAAYADVVRLWGAEGAKGPTVTAARARQKALPCK